MTSPKPTEPASTYPLHSPHNALHRWSLSTRTIANYVRLEQIGEGTYGQVYRARPINEYGHADTAGYVALKKIRLQHPGYWGIPPTVLREIKILKQLSHGSMVKMLEVVSSKGVEHLDWEEESQQQRTKKASDKHTNVTPMPSNSDEQQSNVLKQYVDSSETKEKQKKQSSKKKELSDHDILRESYKGSLFLVLEYVSYDLTGLLDMAYKFTEVQAKSLMWQLLDVLEYMHERKFVHRDLKSSNLLITKDFRVKLADFGLARCLDDGNPRIISGDTRDRDYTNEGEFTNKVITLWYRPPELLLGETRYGTAVDIWSAGCILAEIILGRPIFTGKTEMDQLKLIFDLIGTPTPKTWEGFNELKLIRTKEVTIDKLKRPKLREKYGSKIQPMAALNLLEKLLELDPKKRMSARAAINHRYFRIEPIAPLDPSELGTIDLGDGNDGSGYHEFQTKKRRREAKAVAKQAEDEARRRGEDVEKQKEAFDKAYREHLKKGAEKDKEKTKLKEKLQKHKRDLEMRDQELQLEMQMFPEQREFDQQQEGLQRMQGQHAPPSQRKQQQPYGRNGYPEQSRHQTTQQQELQYERNWNEQQHYQDRQDDGHNTNQSYPHQQDRYNQSRNREHRSNVPSFNRDGAENWRQQPNDSQQQFHRHQHPGDNWQRLHPNQKPSFDEYGGRPRDNQRRHPPNQPLDRNPDNDRYGPRHQAPFDRDGRGEPFNGSHNQQMLPPSDRRMMDASSRRINRHPDNYNQMENPSYSSSRDRNRPDEQFRTGTYQDHRGNRPHNGPHPHDRHGGASFHDDDNRRRGSDGWNGRKRGHEDVPFRPDGGKGTSENQTERDAVGREGNFDDEQNRSQKHNNTPLIDNDISLEAAEELMLRDFGEKPKDAHQTQRSRDKFKERNHGLDKRHRDKSNESREYQRSYKSHHHTSSMHRDEERGSRVDESNAEVARRNVDGDRDRPSSVNRNERGDSKDRSHHSNSHHRKRDGDVDREHSHHKRSRHESRHRDRRDRDDDLSVPRDDRRKDDRMGDSSAPLPNRQYDRFGNPIRSHDDRYRRDRDDRRRDERR